MREILSQISIFILLIFTTMTDIRKREIPIRIYLALILPLGLILRFPYYGELIISVAIFGAIFGVLAVRFEGGGGDIIMVCCISTVIGLVKTTQTVFLASLALCIFQIILRLKKRNVREIPFAPFMFVGYTISLLLL